MRHPGLGRQTEYSRDVYSLKVWTELSSSIFDDPTFIEHLSSSGLLFGSRGGSGGGAACCLDQADLSAMTGLEF